MPTSVVCPITATFTADGAANLKQVQQEQIAALTSDFDLYVSDGSANDVFKAFAIAEGVSDPSADIVVSVVSGNETIVKAALDYALQNALGGAGATSATTPEAGKTLKLRMQTYVKAQVEADLSSTGLFNILEAEELLDVNIPNADIGSNGSTEMWLALAGTTPGSPLLNVIATQLPYAQYADISGGGNLDAAFEAGDKLVFHFTINTTLAITPVNQDVTSAIGTSAGASAQALFNSNQKNRTFNLHITKAA